MATAAATATTPAPGESPGVEEDAAEPQNPSGSVFTAHNNNTAGLPTQRDGTGQAEAGKLLGPGAGAEPTEPWAWCLIPCSQAIPEPWIPAAGISSWEPALLLIAALSKEQETWLGGPGDEGSVRALRKELRIASISPDSTLRPAESCSPSLQ